MADGGEVTHERQPNKSEVCVFVCTFVCARVCLLLLNSLICHSPVFMTTVFSLSVAFIACSQLGCMLSVCGCIPIYLHTPLVCFTHTLIQRTT